MKFTRVLNEEEIDAAVCEWLHRRGQRPVPGERRVETPPGRLPPHRLAYTIVVEAVPPEPTVTYEPRGTLG